MAEITKNKEKARIQSYMAVEGATKVLELAKDMLAIVLLWIKASR